MKPTSRSNGEAQPNAESWLQYALLKAFVPAIAKGSIVFLATLALSWGVAAALRRIPAVARVI